MNQQQFFKRLEALYQDFPGKVITAITRNTSYLTISDERVKYCFPELIPLYTGRCSHRQKEWWRDRHGIMCRILSDDIISTKEFLAIIKSSDFK